MIISGTRHRQSLVVTVVVVVVVVVNTLRQLEYGSNERAFHHSLKNSFQRPFTTLELAHEMFILALTCTMIEALAKGGYELMAWRLALANLPIRNWRSLIWWFKDNILQGITPYKASFSSFIGNTVKPNDNDIINIDIWQEEKRLSLFE